MAVVFNPFTGDFDFIDDTAAAGTDTQVQFNDGGALAGDSGLVFNKTTNALTGGSFIPTSSTVPTNGVYSPGANQLAISTNGTGRLFVDASGKIGLGVASPTEEVDIAGDVYMGTGVIKFENNLGIYGYDTSSTIRRLFHLGTDNNLYFNANSLANNQIFQTNNAERLRITSDGKVGLGTSSPVRVFHAVADGAPVARFERDTSDGAVVEIRDFNNNTVGSINTASATVGLYGSGGGGLNIDSSNRVGVGTTSPGATLEVDRGGLVRSWTPNVGTYGLFIGGGTNYFSLVGDNGADLLFGSGSSQFLGRVRYENSTNALSLWTSNSERARIDSSGRLLVGTSSGRSVYGIGASIFNEGTFGGTSSVGLVRNSNNAGGPYVLFAKSRGTSNGSSTLVQADDNLGGFAFAGADGSDLETLGALIECRVDGTPGTNDMPGRLVFSTTADGASSPTERMRIRQEGAIDTFTAAGSSLQVRNATTLAGNVILGCTNGATNLGSGTQVFVVRGDGDCENTNNSYGALSDIKLKENIVDASSQWDDIKALRPVNYNFKEETGYGTHTQIGLVAQEVELVSPGLVSESPDRDKEGNDLGTVTKSVNYSVLYMKAVKALQEAMERIETLEAKVAALEAN